MNLQKFETGVSVWRIILLKIKFLLIFLFYLPALPSKGAAPFDCYKAVFRWNKKPKPAFKQAIELFKAEGVYGEKLKGQNLSNLYSAFRKEHPDFNLPSNPHRFYKDQGWKGLRDFFGLSRLTLEEAKELFKAEGVYGGKLKGKNLEKLYNTIRNERPDFNLPSSPAQLYKDQGWKGLRDFFSLEELSRPTLEEAKELFKAEGVYGGKLKGQNLFEIYNTIRNERPDFNLPSTPEQFYKGQGWKGLRDFFSLEELSRPTLEEAKELFKAEGVYGGKLEGQNLFEIYNTFRKDHPDFNLPSDPQRVYKDQGWKGLRDFFGLSRPTLEEAKELFKAEGVYGEKLKGKSVEKLYSAFRNEHPDFNLPFNPSQFYKDQGWKGYRDFFGLSQPTLEEAKGFFKDEGVYGEKLKGQNLSEIYKTFRNEHPDFNLPSNPHEFYKGQGWKGLRDFFGLEGKKHKK